MPALNMSEDQAKRLVAGGHVNEATGKALAGVSDWSTGDQSLPVPGSDADVNAAATGETLAAATPDVSNQPPAAAPAQAPDQGADSSPQAAPAAGAGGGKDDPFGDYLQRATADKQVSDSQADADRAQSIQHYIGSLQTDLQRRISADVAAGVAPEQIRKKYADDISQIQGQKDKLSALAPAAGQTPTTSTPGTQVQTAANPNIKLASTSNSTMEPYPGQGPLNLGLSSLDDAMAPMMRGYDMQEAAYRQAAITGQHKGIEEAAAYQSAADDNDKRIKAQQAAAADQQQQLTGRIQKLDALSSDINNAKVDPDHFWASRSTGDKIAAGIGVILGAFGSGGNKAVDVIDKAISRDIDAQKANIDNKRAAFNSQRGIYQDMLAQFKDQDAAANAARVAYLDNAIVRIQGSAAKYSGPEAQNQANLAIGQLQTLRDQAKQSFAQNMMKYMPVSPNANPELLTDDQRKRFVPGFGLALADKDAEDMKATVDHTGAAKDTLRQLMQIANTPGASLDPNTRTKASVLTTTLKGQLHNPIFGGDRFTDATSGMLDDITRNPARLWSLSSNNRAALQAIGGVLDSVVQTKANALGFQTSAQKLGFKASK